MMESAGSLTTLIQENFYLIQIAIGALFLFVAWRFMRPKEESGFRVREADRHDELFGPGSGPTDPDRTANLKRRRPLALPGISIEGEPHEILGVRRDASTDEIRAAYLTKVKQYHPDRVGKQGSRQWEDAQKIAAALNRAKHEMLSRRKS